MKKSKPSSVFTFAPSSVASLLRRRAKATVNKKTTVGKQKSTQDIYIRRAQDRQDEIFRKMSADEKIKLGSGLWRLAKELDPRKIDYRLWLQKQ